MFQATTQDIKVEVEPSYIPEQSNPADRHYFFSYKVRLTNHSQVTVKLVSRHWIITDGFGQVEEVVGPGVIGQQPSLEPGESFEYSSFCPLTTPTGSMKGTYVMTSEKNGQFEIQIPLFILCEPGSYH